jgi:hypothetical protein
MSLRFNRIVETRFDAVKVYGNKFIKKHLTLFSVGFTTQLPR